LRRIVKVFPEDGGREGQEGDRHEKDNIQDQEVMVGTDEEPEE